MKRHQEKPQQLNLETISCVEELGAYIYTTRTQYGVSQQTLSKVSNVNRSAISRLERGKLEWVSLPTTLKVLNALNVQVKLQKNN